jgi:hypothetical protein
MPLRRLAGGVVDGPRSLIGTRGVFNLIVESLFSVSLVPLAAQQESGWRIQPENINIQVGEERPLQLLDDQLQELRDAKWAVDLPALAEISEQDGRMVVRAKAAGVVTVIAERSGCGSVRSGSGPWIIPYRRGPPIGGLTTSGVTSVIWLLYPPARARRCSLWSRLPRTTTYLLAFSSDGIQLP